MIVLEEPSVLDYVKAKLRPWRGPAPEIPRVATQRDEAQGSSAPDPQLEERLSVKAPLEGPAGAFLTALEAKPAVSLKVAVPWLAFGGLGLALAAQLALEPGLNRTWQFGSALYLAAFILIALAVLRGEILLAPSRPAERRLERPDVRLNWLVAGAASSLAAFWLMGGNRFTVLNTALWIAAIAMTVWAFWSGSGRLTWLTALSSRPVPSRWHFSLFRWTFLVLAGVVLILFFRLHQLVLTPPQMVSDHAEKLLDVWDVLQGETSIYFRRNTGREPMQMYLTAAVAQYLGTGISYLSLKIGTVLAGLLTLPFIYLLGKEIGGRRVALLALVFAGIAYWPNVIARTGLRFPLYPLFVAPTLYFLLRGIRRSSRNDFILAGLSLGIGLHGYTPIRILPLVILAAVGIYLLHRHSAGLRKQTVVYIFLLAFIALIVFLPLLRYSLSNPEMFGYRAFSRLGTVERPLPGPALEIFASNLGRALAMFAWDNGEIWPVSVTHRPALDVVSGALFHGGVLLLLLRYIRRRHWLDLFLLLSIPLLMLPSILSLAYPAENPALNRAGGALVPVFLVVALALDGIMSGVRRALGSRAGAWTAWGLAGVLLLWSASHNYDLVFNQYRTAYERSAWNSDEMGRVIADFASSVGSLDQAWVVAYPHWVDTRLVGMQAGNPTRDYAIFPDQLSLTGSVPGLKLFIVNQGDSASVAALRELYPQGWLQTYDSKYEMKDFLLFVAPGE
jgi:hypothetical protein